MRAAAVAEIPDDAEHAATILELAASDEDVRVRRAAASRVEGPADLVQLARTEGDEELRRELTERLVEIAIAAGDSDGDAAQALEGLDDHKQLAAIAKLSPHDTVRTAALGSRARRQDARQRRAERRRRDRRRSKPSRALRIGAELLNVALKTEHKDAGIAALERAAELT